MSSLYEAGWRQGSIFDADLPSDAVTLDANGEPRRQQGLHGRWLVASQECDLDLTDERDEEPKIELRPVRVDDPPSDWGLRSTLFRITEVDYLAANDPRTTVTASVLTRLSSRDIHRITPTSERSRALAIWLGYRYDRPALPSELLSLGTRIANEVRKRSGRAAAERVRDVLMQFDDQTPPRFSLFALIEDAGDEPEVREWLAGVASRVPTSLGVADTLEAAPAERFPLQIIETSYAADAKQLTWRPDQPGPVGS